MVEMKPGDFAVEVGRWFFEIYEVLKVTDKCFWYASTWSGKERRRDRGPVVFAGPKDLAERLLAQLKSSDALETEETNAAIARRRKRDEQFIAKANEARAAKVA